MTAPRDLAVHRAAALLPGFAHQGDRAAVAKLIEPLTREQVADVMYRVALSAARQTLREIPAGDAHAAFNRLRCLGVARDDMPAWVTAGETVYQRSAKRAQAARREQSRGEAA